MSPSVVRERSVDHGLPAIPDRVDNHPVTQLFTLGEFPFVTVHRHVFAHRLSDRFIGFPDRLQDGASMIFEHIPVHIARFAKTNLVVLIGIVAECGAYRPRGAFNDLVHAWNLPRRWERVQ